MRVVFSNCAVLGSPMLSEEEKGNNEFSKRNAHRNCSIERVCSFSPTVPLSRVWHELCIQVHYICVAMLRCYTLCVSVLERYERPKFKLRVLPYMYNMPTLLYYSIVFITMFYTQNFVYLLLPSNFIFYRFFAMV